METKSIICSTCHCKMKHYDTVERIVRRKNHITVRIRIERCRCPKCGSIHRHIPDYLYPYKQYEADIIDGVVEGLIDSSTLGFEDYPSEITMKRWKRSIHKK